MLYTAIPILIVGVCLVFAFGNHQPIIEDKQEGFNVKFVSKTEYKSDEEGQVIVRITNPSGQLLSADCKVKIFYPDKSVFLDWTNMTLETNGNHYHNFTTPTQVGIYEDHVNCTVGANSRIQSSSFHVSPALNTIIGIEEDLNAHNISVNARLDMILSDLYEHNITVMDYLNAINMSYTEFFNAISSNQTYWFPLIYNNQNVYLPVINQSTTYIIELLEDLNQTAFDINDTEIINYLSYINQTLYWHVYQNVSIYWTTQLDSTFQPNAPITFLTTVWDGDNNLFNDAECNLTVNLPDNSTWIVNTTMPRIMDGTYRYHTLLTEQTGSHWYEVQCRRTIYPDMPSWLFGIFQGV